MHYRIHKTLNDNVNIPNKIVNLMIFYLHYKYVIVFVDTNLLLFNVNAVALVVSKFGSTVVIDQANHYRSVRL